MANMKCRHYSKVCKITCGMTKHVLACKIQQEKAHHIVSCNTSYNTNHFPAMPEAKAILKLAEKGDYKILHLNNLKRRYPVDNDEDSEISDVKYITPISDLSISERITSTESRSGI